MVGLGSSSSFGSLAGLNPGFESSVTTEDLAWDATGLVGTAAVF
jgi:hypothetical protein